ncbi:unnamed protein product [Umbelopsis sp. WA50703]
MSGVIAGGGVVVMHYVGQFAIMFFALRYSVAYIVGAALIGIGATTAALYIFFKLRAQWENQWYKRLGCSMIMGLAVCGMHYVAMAGTSYEVLDPSVSPPIAPLTTAALIAIIASIVVVTCVGLLIIQVWQSKILLRKQKTSQVAVSAIYYDQDGKLLVKDDGTVPMKEIQADTEKMELNELTISNPLFTALFKLTLSWENKTQLQKISDNDAHSYFLDSFDLAAYELANDLKTAQADIGCLYDGIISSGLNKKNSRLSFANPFEKRSSDMDKSSVSRQSLNPHGKEPNRVSQTPTSSIFDLAPKRYNRGKHLFLVRKLPANTTGNYTAQGFRFADPHYISQRMAAKLSVPEDYMLQQLMEMQKYAEHGLKMSTEIERPISVKSHPGVWMGLVVLIEGLTPDENFNILVNKQKRFSLPIVEMKGEDVADHRGPLKPSEKTYLSRMRHSTMLDVIIPQNRSSLSREAESAFVEEFGVAASHFVRAFQQAAKTLASWSTYSHLIASKAILHHEVVETPAFSLASQSCQLILFKAYIISPEISASINAATTDQVKCLPLSLYKSIWEAATQDSIQAYMKKRHSAMQSVSERQLYVTPSRQSVIGYEPGPTDEDVNSLISLPPPPRMRRARNRPEPAKITQLLAGKSLKDKSVGGDYDMSEVFEMVPVLPTSERFQWLQDIIDDMSEPI